MVKIYKSSNKLTKINGSDTIDSNVIIKCKLSLNMCLFYSIYNSLNENDRKMFSANSKPGEEHKMFMEICDEGNLLIKILLCNKFYKFKLLNYQVNPKEKNTPDITQRI